jgi:DNA-binding transcriptional LysR family regulator
MDRLLAMRVFTRIVELRGFGRAADDLGMPRASVTALIKRLEAHLGAQLLQRTTRQVTPTADGEAFYERSLRLLADMEEAESIFREARRNPQGRLRIDLPGSLGRLVVLPALPTFCERYPRLQLEIGMSDRPVDLVREGVDCVVRAGELHDENLVARRLGRLVQITCASPAYLARHGTPEDPGRLEGQRAVNYFSPLSGRYFPMEFMYGDELRTCDLPGSLAVSNAQGYVAAAVAGLGLIQAPAYHVEAQLRSGELVEVLDRWRPPPLPIAALFQSHRQLSQRVRVFVDWLDELFGARPWLLRP